MPIYEYQCTDCGHRLEALQKISDAPLSECPACHGQGLKKLVSAASFRLKGGGWYETDFKKDKRKQLATSDTEPAPKSDNSEQKPANKDAGGKDQQKSQGAGKSSSTASKDTATKASGAGKNKGE